jgi:hypothetical protein
MNRKPAALIKAAILLCVGIAALIVGHAVRAEAGAHSGKTVVFKLKEKHYSRISGTATLTAVGAGVRVVLRLAGPVGTRSPAHIHTGPCRREPTFANPRIWLTLSYVERRTSVTAFKDTTLAQLRARTFSINVHDPDTLGTVACGDVPRGG